METAPEILLVEDERPMADLESEVLKEAGFVVRQVDRGQRALECLATCDQIALVVLDYRLPDMTGADILSLMGDKLDRQPVVVVTGYPDPRIEERMRAAGVFAYLFKDMDLSFLDELPVVARAAIESRS